MAGEYIQASRYTVKAVVYKRQAVESNGVMAGLRVSAIYQDLPSFTASRYTVKAVVASRGAYDANGAICGARVGIIVKSPNGSLSSARFGVIVNQVELGPPARVAETYQTVMRARPVLSPELTLSTEKTNQIYQMSMCGLDVVAPSDVWSMTSSATTAELVLARNPAILPQSLTESRNTAQQALISSVYSAQSMETVTAVAQMALVSLSNVKPSVSMDYAKGVAHLALLARAAGGLPSSPASVARVVQKVLRKRPLQFPRSDTTLVHFSQKILRKNPARMPQGDERTNQVFSLALIGRDSASLPQSPIGVSFSSELVLTASPYVTPTGPDIGGQLAQTVLTATDVTQPVGPIESGQVALMALTRRDAFAQGYDMSASVGCRVLVSAPMHPPGAMSGAMSGALLHQVVLGKDVPAIQDIRSTTGAAQMGLKWLMGARYPSPGDMLPLPRAAQEAGVAHVSLQKKVEALPQSITAIPVLRTSTLMAAEYDRPAAVLQNGVKVFVLAEQSMLTADYLPTGVPASSVQVDFVGFTALSEANDYPDKSYSTSELKVAQVAAQTLSSASDYPDKDFPQSFVEIGQISQNVACTDNSFPDKDLPQSQADLFFISEQALTTASDYPDKDMVKSSVSTGFVAEIAALRANDYPDKDATLSTLNVSICSEQAMLKDTSLYEMPTYAGRNKPMVFTTLVY